jgi:hypothetical protein
MALPPELRRRVEDALSKAKAQVGRISLAVSPPDAAVLLNGRPIGRAARTYTLFVDPGPVTIRARLDGHQDAVQMFELGRGQKQLISLQLSPAPQPVARAPVDAPRKAASPALAARRAAAAEPSSIGWKLSVTGAVLTGVTAAAGAAFLVGAEIAGADLDERSAALRRSGWSSGTCGRPGAPATCAELRDATEQQELFRQIGTASLLASGALGAATLASFLFVWTRPSGGGVRVAPVITGQNAMLSVDGKWR